MTKERGGLRVSQLDSSERIEQLEKIDKLRELGVGNEINLPQLAVVGDQSSGKSSLLEGLSGLPFPVASDLCTRFATQIVFRRSADAEEAIHVSIIPSANSNDAHKSRLDKFAHSMEILSAKSFTELLDEASRCMGLPGSGDDVDNIDKRFSSDVLKIELSGPRHNHLSFIDIPGLFHNPTKYQTEEDRVIIRNLIESYVQDRRTIIMAVMDARNNLANQEVFRIAKAADKDGIRTVGILTKCDAVQKGDEPTAIGIAQNRNEKLTHGWYCVRNRSTQEILSGVTIEERHKNEKAFFDTHPWSGLDKSRVGISSLKASLGRLLSDHVANEFPEIQREINERHAAARKQLEQLGAPRQTNHEQLQYLIKSAGTYQRRVEDALNGRYAATGIHPTKLRMHVQIAHDAFNEEMLTKGHMMEFCGAEEVLEDFPKSNEHRSVFATYPCNGNEDKPNALQNPQPNLQGIANNSVSKDFFGQSSGFAPSVFATPSPYDFIPPANTFGVAPPTVDLTGGPQKVVSKGQNGKKRTCEDNEKSRSIFPQKARKTNIYQEIRDLYQTSRGTELPGSTNPAVIVALFRHQTSQWETIANNHLARIVKLISECNDELFKQACPVENIRAKIRAQVVSKEDQAIMEAPKIELTKLLEDERSGCLATVNHYFADNLAKARAERFSARLKKLGFVDGSPINFQSLTSIVSLSNEASAIYDIHDTLKAYYKVALKRFIDNVVIQVIERNLLSANGPMSIFTAEYVGGLTTTELASIAGEDFRTSNTRTELGYQIARLEEARKVCSGLRG